MKSARKTVRVVAAVVRTAGAYMIAQRPIGKRHGGLWEFPGGKCEEGESDNDAIARELGEELSLRVTRTGSPLFIHTDEDSTLEIVFLPVEVDGHPTPHEHAAIAWVMPSKMKSVCWAPADAVFVDLVIRP